MLASNLEPRFVGGTIREPQAQIWPPAIRNRH